MIDSNAPKAFTIEYAGLVPVLETQCGVCEAYNPAFQQSVQHPTVNNCKAIWDTGAMGSVVSTNVVSILNSSFPPSENMENRVSSSPRSL